MFTRYIERVRHFLRFGEAGRLCYRGEPRFGAQKQVLPRHPDSLVGSDLGSLVCFV